MESYLSKGNDSGYYRDRNNDYFNASAQIEANRITRLAKSLSFMYIHDGLYKTKFEREVEQFVTSNLRMIKETDSDRQRHECLGNLREVLKCLENQHSMLRTGRVTLAATVKLYEDNQIIVGYVIDGIGLLLNGVQIIAGAGLFLSSAMSGNVIGVLAGASIVFNGVSSAIENVEKLAGAENPTNFARDLYEDSAEFLGFDRRSGLLAYQIVDLSTAYYGIMKLAVKPETWRLFRYMPSDYYRKISTMSKGALVIKGVGAGVKAAGIAHNIHEMRKDKKE